MGYEYRPLSHNGVSLQTATLISWYEVDNGPLRAQDMASIEATITGRGQRAVRAQAQGLRFEVHSHLSDLSQSALDALYAIYNEEDGVVYHRMTDDNGVVWRTAVQQEQLKAVTTNHFITVLRSATGYWEADSATTVSNLNVAADTIAISPTNAGNRKTRPVITVTPDLVKTDDIEDYKWSLRAFWVNRAEEAWIDKPIWLFDQSGGQARLATNSSAAGATILQTTGATTLAVNIAALASTITVTSAASWPASGMGYITDTRGNGFHDQFYYTSKAGNVLSGVVWLPASANGGTSATVATLITAGGIAHTTAQVSAIQPSGALLSGDDLRVWIDDVEVNRWLVNWNSAASDVVANVTAPKALKKTLSAAITTSSPGADFNEGALDIQVPCIMAFENELIYCPTKTARGVQFGARGVHGTTSAAHALGTFAYGNPQLITVAVGKATAGAPPAPTGKRPAPQLPGSQNIQWKWGDQADDPFTIYYDKNNPGRTAQWEPGFDDDGNDISPLINLSSSSTIATFKDDAPGDGSPPYNFLSQQFPMPLRTAFIGAIINDWTPSAEILNLEMFVRDASGTWKLIDQLQQAAAAVGRALPTAGSIVGENRGVKLKARYNIVTGHMGTGDFIIVDGAGISNIGQNFTLDRDTYITKVMARLKLSAAGNQNVLLRIHGARRSNGLSAASLPDLKADTQINITNPAYAWVIWTFLQPLFCPAGGYTFEVARNAPLLQTVEWETSNPGFYVESAYTALGAGTWTIHGTEKTSFQIYGGYDNEGSAPINGDQPIKTAGANTRTGITASFDKTGLLWQTAQVPYVHRTGGFTNSLYHATGVLSSSTTGEGFALDKWMLPGTNMVIDCNQRTAVYTEGGVPFPAKGNVAPVNPAEWLTLDPGVNSNTWDEPNMRQTDVVYVYRDVKV